MTHPTYELPTEAVDLVVEALIACPDPAHRAQIVSDLVQEIFATAIWLHPDRSAAEIVSLAAVLDEAFDHRRRMAALVDGRTAPEDGAPSPHTAHTPVPPDPPTLRLVPTGGPDR